MAKNVRRRAGQVERRTGETDVAVRVDLDGSGAAAVATGVGFFDHMLEQLARHALFDLTVTASGDLHVDSHHTVEDTGIALGLAMAEALGERRGIVRYASIDLAMDETLTRAAVDVSGRAWLAWDVAFPAERIGAFDTELCREFFEALARHAGLTLHVACLHGANSHHVAESCFKAVARVLRAAVAVDPREANRAPSTKGVLA